MNEVWAGATTGYENGAEDAILMRVPVQFFTIPEYSRAGLKGLAQAESLPGQYTRKSETLYRYA